MCCLWLVRRCVLFVGCPLLHGIVCCVLCDACSVRFVALLLGRCCVLLVLCCLLSFSCLLCVVCRVFLGVVVGCHLMCVVLLCFVFLVCMLGIVRV